MKKILFIVIAIILIISMVACDTSDEAVVIQENNYDNLETKSDNSDNSNMIIGGGNYSWDGTVDVSWYDVSKSEFILRTAAELAGLAQLTNSGNTFEEKTIILGNNIDLSGREWTPIGFNSKDWDDCWFDGVFDGNGYSVTNFKITHDGGIAGLFGGVTNEIKNLGVKNFNINVDSVYEGAVGGIAGWYSGSVLKNCYANGRIIVSSNDFDECWVGGLVGSTDDTCAVVNCYSNCDISIAVTENFDNSPSVDVGGLIGSSDCAAYNCYSAGNITVTSNGENGGYVDIGGLIGEAYHNDYIACYSTCNLQSKGFDSTTIGGLFGDSEKCTARNCYKSIDQNIFVADGDVEENELGTETDAKNLKDKNWIKENLWIAETDIWIFGNSFPTLNFGYIRNADTVTINSAEDLLRLQGQALVLNYKLTQNINLNNSEWLPVILTMGNFDGDGYVISNFKIKDNELKYIGFFGKNLGQICNLSIKDFIVECTESEICFSVGGLVGHSCGIVKKCYSNGEVLSNADRVGGLIGQLCFFSDGDVIDSRSEGDVIGGRLTGGLVGYGFCGNIVNCYATGNVTGSGEVGGLVGDFSGNITNCYATGNVTGSGKVGGLVGDFSGNITNCYSLGDVTAVGDDYGMEAGGLVGYLWGNVKNCYSIGDVQIIFNGTLSSCYLNAGGLVGCCNYNSSGDITNCYSVGDISVESVCNKSGVDVGGLIGQIEYIDITNGTNGEYYFKNNYRYDNQSFTININGNVTNTATNFEGIAVDANTFKSTLFYTDTLGWSADVWEFSSGYYPKLKNMS